VEGRQKGDLRPAFPVGAGGTFGRLGSEIASSEVTMEEKLNDEAQALISSHLLHMALTLK